MFDSFMTAALSDDWVTLLLRLACGIALMPFAIYKIMHFHEMETKFPDVKPFNRKQSLTLAAIMENTAWICMILGFCTRLVCAPALATMLVAAQVNYWGQLRAPAGAFVLLFLAIFITGPGGYSLDALIF